MKTWRCWQGWAPRLLEVLLLLTPFVFGIATFGSHLRDAWILGVVAAVVAVILALLWLGFPRNRVTEGLTIAVGMLLLVSPWILGETRFTTGAWVSCIMGVLLVVAAAGVSVEKWSCQVLRHSFQRVGTRSGEPETSRPYRRDRATPRKA